MTSKNKRLLQILVIVTVMCFLVVSFSSEKALRRTSKLSVMWGTYTIDIINYDLWVHQMGYQSFTFLAKTRYPWSERDAVYPITAEEKSDILDRISSEVRKAVAQAAEETKIHLENKEALAKNAS